MKDERGMIVRDRTGCRKYNVTPGTILHSNNYGNFIFLEEYTAYNKYKNTKERRAIIRFLDTGTEKDVSFQEMIHGEVKDQFRRTIYDVACIGNGSYKENKKIYKIWLGIIERCYNKNCPAYKFYGAKGVTVCERWLCFENFLEDIKKKENYDKLLTTKNQYTIDKDLLQQNVPHSQRVYSDETTLIIPTTENTKIAVDEKRPNTKTNYYGVKKKEITGRYEASIRTVNGRLYLGTYETEEAAATVYDHHSMMLNRPFRNNTNMNIYDALAQRTNHKTVPMCYRVMCKIVE